ncbi:MAG: radical SAM family heme chaperone HemW [Clostridiales bacterium]|nr:radical SAM family heme chaperone HemW [Clostridiales bacterium]
MKKVGIYVHFPFCVSKCKYCNFNSYADKNEFQQDYLRALVKEIQGYSDKSIVVNSIFIGGGTPSVMFDGCVSTLLSVIRSSFQVEDDAEVSIESNPNSITLTKVREWQEAGVNRVSIGLQTANNNSLRLLGRVHTRQDYINAVDIVRSVGITNINTDCLIGVPKQKLSNVKYMLALINKLKCPHISVYSLILEEDTELCRLVNSGAVKLPKESKTLGMYNFVLKYLREQGYDRYEVSNFAKPNMECKHNRNIWNMSEYLGFGAGAHSYFKGDRYSNVLSIEEYISLISSGKTPIDARETISKDEVLEETIMLGLRTREGINLSKMKEELDVDLNETKKDAIKYLIDNKFIEIDGDYLRATDLGFTVLNKVILELV